VVGLIHLLGLGAVMGFGWFRFCYARVAGQRQPWCEDVLPDVYSVRLCCAARGEAMSPWD
jgi:hypothetical protein